MRLSRASTYAVGAVLQLVDAPPGEPVPCSRLAKAGAMPERFLLQVLRQLVNHDLLKSTRGVDGGYSLAKPPEEITLLHIIEATDGPVVPILPPLDSIPEQSREKLQQVLHDITAEDCRSLGKIPISSFCTSRSDEGDRGNWQKA